MPYYTDPESKALFAAKRRPKKKAKPIEGHDVTIQASQPGHTEDTVEHDATNSTATGNTSTNTGAIQDVESTIENATNAATRMQPTAEPEHSSSGAVPSHSSQDETPKVRATDPAADGTTSDDKPESSKDGEAVKSEVAPAGPRMWADLFNKASVASKAAPDGQVTTNGINETQASGAVGPSQPISKQLGDVLKEYNPSNGKVFFIEPRGLYNARVDCYMISVSRI